MLGRGNSLCQGPEAGLLEVEEEELEEAGGLGGRFGQKWVCRAWGP